MSSRAAELASAILIGVLVGVFAGAYLIIMPFGAADDCLTEPKGDAPQGQHWFYRIDRGTKRHCWYLKGQGEKLAREASPERSASEKTPPRRADTAAQHAISDAHAELRSRARIEDNTSAVAARAAQAPVVANAAAANANNTVADDTNAGSNNVMSRWPEPAGVNSSVSAPQESPPLVVADNTQPDPAATVTSTTMPSTPMSSMTPMSTAPDEAAGPAAASTSIGKYSGSLQELLVVAFAALALAGLSGSAVYRLASLGRARRRYNASRRSVDWQQPKKKSRRARPVDPRPVHMKADSMKADSVAPRPDFAPEPRPHFAPQPRPQPQAAFAAPPNVAVLSEYAPKPRPGLRTPELQDSFDSIEELLMRLAK
jgi:hypothetical protein